MEHSPQIINLRRFSFTVAIALILYALYRGDLPDELIFVILGITLPLKKAYLNWGLPVLSIYAVLRFSLDGILLVTPPFTMRGDLKDGRIPLSLWGPGGLTPALGLRKKIQVFFPRIDLADLQLVDDKENKVGDGREINTQEHNLFKLKLSNISLTTYFLIVCNNVDYTAPIWLNVIALVLAAWLP